MSDPQPQSIATAGRERSTAIAQRAAPEISAAIRHAARTTNVDFGFLVAQAQVESAMDPKARAETSSATGLYQFIDSTWLETMKQHGPRFGLGDMSAQIGRDARGAAFVADPSQRAAILAMRNDPQVASLMAAGLAQDNRAQLAPILGREPDHGELYLAHFLGAGGASRFLSALHDDPAQSAAALFSRPAAANPGIFYAPGGDARSLQGVMDLLSAKLARAGSAEKLESAPAASPSTAAHFAAAPSAGSYRANARAFAPLGTAPPLPPAAARTGRTSMSELLRTTLEPAGAMQDKGAAQVRRAYDSLRALGL